MDNLEVNKAVAAVLVGGIVFMMSGVVAGLVVKPQQLHHSVLKIETSAPAAGGGAKEEPLAPIAPLLASADVAAGEALAKKQCAACHSFNDGGKNGVGPNLWGVVGRGHGVAAGYTSSDALKKKEGPWTYEEMNAWLKKPSAYASGTKMAFAGIASEKQRADVIAFLRSLSANPLPLP